MITFKQYLMEDEVANLADLLYRDCRPYLEELHGEGIFRRGVQGLTAPIKVSVGDEQFRCYKKLVRKDRKPKDMRAGLHMMLDDWFDAHYNMRPRSEAMFCFGNQVGSSILSQYGEICYVFPIGKISYIWSPKVDDLFNEIDHRTEIYNDEDEFNTWMETRNYQTTDLEAAVRKDSEVMIVCDAYYAINTLWKEEIFAAVRDAQLRILS